MITIVWMGVQAALSLWLAWRARSPALLAFSGDSLIELFSATVVLWRFATGEQEEQRASRIAAVLLFVLASTVAITSAVTLSGRNEPRPTRFRMSHAARYRAPAATGALRSRQKSALSPARTDDAL